MSFSAIAAVTIHDVKNRLAALAARAEARGDTDTLAVALETAAALTRLLAYYRASTGTLALDIDGHAPGDLVDDLLRELAPMSTKSLVANTDAAPTLWFYDEALIRMVLANALQNALRCAREQVTVSVVERDDWLEFVVRDDGPGFPADVLDNPAAARVSGQGTGLGLLLTREVARLHENAGRSGEMELGNDDGGVWTLRLPR